MSRRLSSENGRIVQMNWRKMLAYIIGSVGEELQRRNECLVAENAILRS